MTDAGETTSQDALDLTVATVAGERLGEHQADLEGLLGEIVAMESATDDDAAVRALGRHLTDLFRPYGTVVRTAQGGTAGHSLVVRVDGRESGSHLAVFGHFDTGWPIGTIDAMPFERVGDDLVGPGVCDAKGGVVAFLVALETLHALGTRPRRSVRALLRSNGASPTSRSEWTLASVAPNAAFGIGLGPPSGGLRVEQRGRADYTFDITSAARTNATLQMATLIGELDKLAEDATLRVTSAEASRAGATVAVEIEASDPDVLEGAELRLQEMVAGKPSEVQLTRGIRLPPMPAAPAELIRTIQAVATAAGTSIEPGPPAAASDANLLAARAVPSVDGLGPEGFIDDTIERIRARSLVERAAVLAGLLAVL